MVHTGLSGPLKEQQRVKGLSKADVHCTRKNTAGGCVHEWPSHRFPCLGSASFIYPLVFEFFVFCVLYVGQGVYDFRPCDKIVDWAIGRGMEVKGHTLCWHVTTPEFAEDMSASRLREALYRRDRETERQRGRHTDRRIDAQYGTRSYGRHEGGTK